MLFVNYLEMAYCVAWNTMKSIAKWKKKISGNGMKVAVKKQKKSSLCQTTWNLNGTTQGTCHVKLQQCIKHNRWNNIKTNQTSHINQCYTTLNVWYLFCKTLFIQYTFMKVEFCSELYAFVLSYIKYFYQLTQLYKPR